MKAVAIGRFGGLTELKEYDLPKPEPAADEVLIRVRAAGWAFGTVSSGQGAECGRRPAVYTCIRAKRGAYAQVNEPAEFYRDGRDGRA